MVLEAVLGTSSAPVRNCINARTVPSQLTPTATTFVMLQSRMLWLLRGASAAEAHAAKEHPQGTQQQDLPGLEGPHSAHGGGGWLRLQQQLERYGQDYEQEESAQGWAGLVAVEGGAAACVELLRSTRLKEGKPGAPIMHIHAHIGIGIGTGMHIHVLRVQVHSRLERRPC